MLDYAAIGRNIRTIQKTKNLSQEQLAEKIWISTTHMSHIETGSTKLSLAVLVDIADALQVGTDELLSTQPFLDKKYIKDEIHIIVQACTSAQARVLLDLMKAAKNPWKKTYNCKQITPDANASGVKYLLNGTIPSGERSDRRRWRRKGGERVAAVDS